MENVNTGRKQYLYHVTKPQNVATIFKEGLKRKYGFAVYLSENPMSWWKPGLVILKVRITGLKGEMKTFLPESDEILYFDDISPLRVHKYAIPRRVAQGRISKLTKESEG